MSNFNLRPGDVVDVVVRGHVIYDVGGFVRISDQAPAEGGRQEEGSHALEIPGYMIVGEPVAAPRYEPGALFLDENTYELWQYGLAGDGEPNKFPEGLDRPWFRLSIRAWSDKAPLRPLRLYREGEV